MRCGISFRHPTPGSRLPALRGKSSPAFGKYYFWKFELIIDSMSSVCPELLAHLRGFRFRSRPIFQLPFWPWLTPLPTRVLACCFRILLMTVVVVGHGIRVGLGSDFWMLRSLLLVSLALSLWYASSFAACSTSRLTAAPVRCSPPFPTFRRLCGRHVVLTEALCNRLLGAAPSAPSYCLLFLLSCWLLGFVQLALRS